MMRRSWRANCDPPFHSKPRTTLPRIWLEKSGGGQSGEASGDVRTQVGRERVARNDRGAPVDERRAQHAPQLIGLVHDGHEVFGAESLGEFKLVVVDRVAVAGELCGTTIGRFPLVSAARIDPTPACVTTTRAVRMCSTSSSKGRKSMHSAPAGESATPRAAPRAARPARRRPGPPTAGRTARRSRS